ncbi:MAG: hypothetical protein ABI364_08045, partial [Caldimonas sp.]
MVGGDAVAEASSGALQSVSRASFHATRSALATRGQARERFRPCAVRLQSFIMTFESLGLPEPL